MRKNYDFSDSKPNPYAKRLKKQITIKLEEETINYFKDLSAETVISYQNLINLFLRDCAEHHKKPQISWKEAKVHP
ncbi:MAG: antitoxin [Chitinivibrionales bacterium]